MKTIKFNYLYRDAGNYKKWGEVVFSNPDGLALDKIDSQLKQAFDSEQFFTASQIQVPEVFLYNEDFEINDEDHCFHEYESVEMTTEKPNDSEKRTIQEFIKIVLLQSDLGWQVFDPELRSMG